MVALLLCIFLGFLGIHRFYLGYPLIGIIQLLTLGMCGIWYLIDFFRICFGDLKPKNGVYDPEL
ncbi:MAG: TM2 domain-containing protein [Bacteroidetes bacterium]|nr:TM2 domain-containing protein [Bacteroidota bacterium]